MIMIFLMSRRFFTRSMATIHGRGSAVVVFPAALTQTEGRVAAAPSPMRTNAGAQHIPLASGAACNPCALSVREVPAAHEDRNDCGVRRAILSTANGAQSLRAYDLDTHAPVALTNSGAHWRFANIATLQRFFRLCT
jgi:hypothetical protein